ncbi:Fic family protein [Burkholderia alba]|uniref:hypothetical protein n=1 Tax=Burkholderia alba TaxID=2683677 RepID=UPI002B05DA14|nr:hypothetical protein [Burkholderia alba]
MHASNMIEPAFPNDGERVRILDAVADFREGAARLSARVGRDSRNALAPLLRAMNSYDTNRIEGQHTYPAGLEAAIEKNFSVEQETFRRQKLAVAHMQVETELEPVAIRSAWSDQFREEWICRIHRDLYQTRPPPALMILDAQGNEHSAPEPGMLRNIEITVGAHRAPPPAMLPDPLHHSHFATG